MNNDQEKRKDYESPLTKKTQVELENGICVTSGERIENKVKMEVQVDNWTSIDNDVEFN